MRVCSIYQFSVEENKGQVVSAGVTYMYVNEGDHPNFHALVREK